MELLEKLIRWCDRGLVFLAGLFLSGMILLTCLNIFFRLTWMPIKGTFELMGFMGAVVTAFALGYTQLARGHIGVDVLVNRFSGKTQRLTRIINDLICFVFFSIAAWQISIKATTLWRTGEVTETLRIIYYPFTYAVAAGCALLSLVLILDMAKTVFSGKEAGN